MSNKLAVIISALFISSAFGNAIIPITSMWDGPSFASFLVFCTIILAEIFLLKKMFKTIRFRNVFLYALIVNLASSFLGTLIKYFFDNFAYSSSVIQNYIFLKEPIGLFFFTCISEWIVLSLLFFKKINFKICIKVFFVNFISHILMILSFMVWLLFEGMYNYEHETLKKEWNKENVIKDVTQDFLYSSYEKPLEINSKNKNVLLEVKEKKLHSISNKFAVLSSTKKNLKLTGSVYNWETGAFLSNIENVHEEKIQFYNENSFYKFIIKGDLQLLKAAGNGYQLLGTSYRMDIVKSKNEVRNVNLEDIYYPRIFSYNNETIYVRHSACKHRKEVPRRNNPAIVCENFSTSIVALDKNKKTRVLVRDATSLYLANDSLYYQKRGKLYKKDLQTKEEVLVLNETIIDFVVSKDAKYILFSLNNRVLSSRSNFLVLMDVTSLDKYIVVDGVTSFDFID